MTDGDSRRGPGGFGGFCIVHGDGSPLYKPSFKPIDAIYCGIDVIDCCLDNV